MNQKALLCDIERRIMVAIRRTDIPQSPEADAAVLGQLVDRLRHIGQLPLPLQGFYLLMEEMAGKLSSARGELRNYLAGPRPHRRAQLRALRENVCSAELGLEYVKWCFNRAVTRYFKIRVNTYSTLYIRRSDWVVLGLRA